LQQQQNVITILQSIGADIYGLTEVVDETKLAAVVSQLEGYSYVIGNYGSHVVAGSPLSEAQKLAFVYKTSIFSNVSVRPLINNLNTTSTSYNNWSSGRYPLLMTADVTLNCVTKRISFVLIHAKANTAPTATSYARRQAAARELYDTLQTYFAEENVIILGDFNDDLDRTITDGINPPVTSYSSFTSDNINYFSPTLSLSLAGKKSTVSYNDVIDHVVISNELQPYYMQSTATILTDVATLVSNYSNTTSDHYPVFTRYQFDQPAPPVITSCPAPLPFCQSSNNNYTIPAFTATSSCGSIIYNYQISGATVRSGATNDASGVFNTGTSIISWTATDGVGNTISCQSTIVVNTNPTVNISDAVALSSGVLPNTVYVGYSPASSLTLTATGTGSISSYSWSNGINTSSITVSPTTTTNYSVTVTDANGCQATATKTVNVVDVRSGKKLDKVLICHKAGKSTNGLQIDEAAVATHLSHGDMLGTCTTMSPAITATNMNEKAAEFNRFLITAFPNPARTSFTISINGNPEIWNLQVVDVHGRVLKEQKILNQANQVYIGNLKKGIYILRLVGKTGIYTDKLIIE
jgi:hypothetical protein